MTEPSDWRTQNQRYLARAIDRLRGTLNERLAADEANAAPSEAWPELVAETAEWQLSRPPALEMLSQAFGLTQFERALLLLCAAVELDHGLARLCGRLQGVTELRTVSFGFALSVLPNPHWSAIVFESPLRRFSLLEVLAGPTLSSSPLRIEERVLHYLVGIDAGEPRLAGIIDSIASEAQLVRSHLQIAQRAGAAWCRAGGSVPVQLCGVDRAAKLSIFARACRDLKLKPTLLPVQALPSSPAEVNALVRVLARESVLSASALLIDCEGATFDSLALARFIDALSSPVAIAVRDRIACLSRDPFTAEVARPTADEQAELWRESLAPLGLSWNGQIGSLVGQFSLGAVEIQSLGRDIVRSSKAENAAGLSLDVAAARVWSECRERARPQLADHAQRIVPAASWSDLVLPASERQLLREIVAHARARHRVHAEWGFAARSSRGLSLTALFSGPSGTGKTMAAEVLANELKLDLYRIDLSQVVSKYIGETEKNLRRVFDAAEAGGAVLLFDEADALFGKRSEVKDSHDRYANIEVSYLLQRMEDYRGVAVLTTNMKDALDAAFLRRIRFLVQFPFPNLEERAEIWRRILPSQTPQAALNHQKLAALNIAGGNIRNIAVYAAFLAADDGAPVSMKHLLRAARVEFAKLERSLADSDVRGWE
jgi:hypothetical protein